MSLNEITCALVDEGELDTRYLAGSLSEEEAEAFEAHFFGCERCWELVHQGLAVQSAFHADPPARSPAISATPARANRRWWGLAAAAAVAAVAFGMWWTGFQPQPSLPEDVFRGESTALLVVATSDSADLTASWPRVTGADVYRVRLYGADGSMAIERETPDTSVSVPLDSIAAGRDAGVFWQVQALDRLRNSVGMSDLIRAVLPNP